MHCKTSATTAVGLGPIAGFSAVRSHLTAAGFEPRTFRSVGEISTATPAWVPGIYMLVPYIYLTDWSEKVLKKYKKGTSRIRSQVVGMKGHWRLGFNVRILNIEGDVSYFVIYGSERLERRSDFVAPISGGTGLTQIVVLVFCRNKGIQLDNGSPFKSQNSMSERVYCVLENPGMF